MWLFWALLILVVGLWYIIPKKFDDALRRDTYLLVLFVVFACLVCLRAPTVGNDTISYHSAYQRINTSSTPFASFGHRYELGFIMVVRFFGWFTTNPQFYLAAFGLFFLVVFFWFVRKHSLDPQLSMILFFSMNFLLQGMNIVRLSSAYALALLFYDFFIRKKYVMSILFLVSATLFHRASLVLLVFFAAYFVFRRYRSHFTTLIVALVAMPLLPLLLRLAGNILPYYNSYLNSIYADNQFGLGSFLILGVQLVIFFLAILPYCPANTCNLLKSRTHLLRQARTSLNRVVSIKETRPKEYIFLLALFFAVILAMMSLVFNILDRTVQFFSVVALVQLPESISRYYPLKKQFWVRTSVICGFLLYIAIIVYLRPEWNRVFPYRFIN